MRPVLLLLWLAVPASADVLLSEPFTEVSADYANAPVHMNGGTMVASGVSFSDRRSVFPHLLAQIFFRPGPPSVSPTESHEIYRHEGFYYTTTIIETTQKPQAQIDRELADATAKYHQTLADLDSFSDYYTDVAIWWPQEGLGNVRGGSFAMSLSIVTLPSVFSIEAGIGWQYMKSDVCTPTCRYKFLGMPVRGIVALGRLGWVEAGVDWNWRNISGDDDADPMSTTSTRSRAHVSLTLNPIDRLFVRGEVFDTFGEWSHPGYGVSVGGRL